MPVSTNRPSIRGAEALWTVALAAALVAASALVVAPRMPNAEDRHRRVAGDALLYARMVEGDSTVEAPFRYRVAVPALARALPLGALPALRAITWASVLLGFVFLVRTLRHLGLGWDATGASLLCVAASQPNLYLFYNPFLTDGAGWLIVCAVTYAIVTATFPLFACAIVAGIAVREASLFAAPAWLALRGERLRAVAVVALGIVTWLGIRHLVGVAPAPTRPPLEPFRLIGDVAIAWHALWGLGIWGLFRLPVPQRASALWLGLLLSGGALLASVFATDHTRMFLSVGPVLALGLAKTFERLGTASRAARALVVACLAAAVVWTPVIGLEGSRGAALWRPFRVVAVLGLVAATVSCARRLRHSRREPTGPIAQAG